MIVSFFICAYFTVQLRLLRDYPFNVSLDSEDLSHIYSISESRRNRKEAGIHKRNVRQKWREGEEG